MVYVVVKQPPMFHQMTLEEFLFQDTAVPVVLNASTTNTRTYEVEQVSPQLARKFNISIEKLIQELEEFNAQTEPLRQKPRRELYYEFYIPKKSGGLRKIDAPEPELMDALRRLKTIFENDFKALYHTSAFAYIKKRSTLDAVKRHQANESRWFGKYDLSNFFGSTTLEFIMEMFSMVYPFSEVAKSPRGAAALEKALELATLDGVLPQGTPVSPLITNIMMIPVDYKLANGLRSFNRQQFVYTRYADDFLVSSKYDFDFRAVEQFIVSTLASFEAPFTIKSAKTRYGSSAGKNWNLGVMLNANNQITIGHKKKRQFQAMICSFVLDTQHGNPWPLEDIQRLEGYRNYYRMIEGNTIDALVKRTGDKYGVDVPNLIKEQMRAS